MISLGSGCDLALEYRWKHMGRGLGWAVRGRSQHGLLDRALEGAFTEKDIDKAVRELQVAAEADRDAVGAKQTVKASKVIEHMKADPGSRLLCKALVFVRP